MYAPKKRPEGTANLSPKSKQPLRAGLPHGTMAVRMQVALQGTQMDGSTANPTMSKRSSDWRGLYAIGLVIVFAMLTAITDCKAGGEEPTTPEMAASSSDVPSFYVRAVTGPLAGKSVCYVCRNGDRPAVIVLLRELGPDSIALLRELDQVVNQHRAQGLRCFAVLLTEQPQRDAARLQTVAFDEKLNVPLTLASNAAIQGSTLAFSRDQATSVVMYSERKIVQRYSFQAGSCDEKLRKSIVTASQKLLEQE